MKVKVTETNSLDLTVGKEYEVKELRINKVDESMLIGCDVIDDDGEIYTIVNFDEATYVVVEV